MRSAKTIVLVSALLGASCASSRPVAIMPWSEYQTRSVAWPYVRAFEAPRGSLLYFGAHHTYQPRDREVQEIVQLWTVFRPTIAFHEGWSSTVESTIDMAVETSGEPGLVRFLASRDGIPFASLDPSLQEEVAYLKKTFSVDDVKLFFLLRPLAELVAREPDANLDAELDRVLLARSQVPGLEGAPRSAAEVARQAATRLPEWSGCRSLSLKWFDPAQTDTFLNRVSRASSEYRDRSIVSTLDRNVAAGRRVFAVVGGSHVVMQESALSALLGVRGRRPTSG